MGFFPILQYGGKNPMGFFDFFKIAYYRKIIYEINSVDIHF